MRSTSRRNEVERGFDFLFAARIFLSRTVEIRDDRGDYGEGRVKAIGQVGGITITVVYTDRGEARRVIFGKARQPEGTSAMADVRVTLVEGQAGGRVRRRKVDSTTDEDIRRQMREDGEDPDAPLLGPFRVVHPPAEIRQRTGLTQVQIAERLGLPLKTWQNWEQGRTALDPAVRGFLTLVADDPARAFRILSPEGKPPG